MRIVSGLSVMTLFVASALAASAPRVDRIEVVAAGLFKSTLSGKIANPASASGTRAVVAREVLLRKTTGVKARLGTEFGLRYRIVGAPKGAKVPVTIVTNYPSEGLANPATGKTTTREELKVERSIGRVAYESFKFDHDWEMVPGAWSFEIWYDGKKMLEQKFTVAKP